MSMFTCIKQLRDGSTTLHHISADSVFAAAKSFKKLIKLYNTHVTISINNSPTSGLAFVYNFISQDLSREHARLYQSESILIEVVQCGDYTNTIATNAFRIKGSPSSPSFSTHSVESSNLAGPLTSSVPTIPRLSIPLSYETALVLWQKESVVTLKQLFGLSTTYAGHDPVDIILIDTGKYFFKFFFLFIYPSFVQKSLH
jgi:hypothetical protein